MTEHKDKNELLSLSESKVNGIAILGSHPETVAQAPFRDESWHIYACSPHNIEHRTLPRVTEWFEIHKPIQDVTRSYRYLRALEDLPCTVWMRDEENMHKFKNAKLYPERELRGRLVKGPDGDIYTEDGLFYYDMFTSSIAFILAKAIVDCEKYSIPAIGLWGIMQASENEYMYQRPGVKYFMSEARKRGIKVVAPRESRLFAPQKEVF